MDREFLEQLNLDSSAVEAILAESQKEQAAHDQAVAELVFDQKLDAAIGAEKGRNVKAIRALLDVDGLRAAEQPEAEIRAALARLKRESGYLFQQEQVPYAPGAGTGGLPREYSQEELGRMSMEEYRAYRAGRAASRR